jgi:uncharacterized protein (TIGR03437 family)
MQFYRTFLPVLLYAVAALAPIPSYAATPGPPANVVMVAGNGQVVQLNFATTVPMTILVTDANGIPVPGVAVAWSITQNADKGTLNQPTGQTDSNGLSTSNFIGNFINPGESYVSFVINAMTSVGSVSFVETAVPLTTTSGQLAQPPFIQLNTPSQDNLVVTGTAGSTLPGAVVVVVVAGSGIGLAQGIPNVGMRIVGFTPDPSAPTPPAPAACNAQAGITLSDSRGFMTCDLVLGNTPGTYPVTALIGEFQNTRTFTIKITQAPPCTFTLTPLSQSFAATAGSGSVNVSAQTGCTWTAISNAPALITVTSGASGSGNGTVTYNVAANTATSRSGTLSIAGQTFTVSQNAVGTGPGPLTITSGQNLPGGIVNSFYNAPALTASGGQPFSGGVYSWQVTGGTPPPGVTLASSSGVFSGTPTATGTYTFTVTVTDSANAQQSQMFTIVISAAGTGGLSITNPGFPNGIVGVAYNQVITYTPVPCGSPFSPGPVIALQAGSLPPGLSVQSNGAGYSIAGTPTGGGSFSFTLGISNTCGQSGSASFTITIGGTGNTTILNANPLGFTFNATQGGSAQTGQLTITSTGTAVAITATASAASGGNWLAVSAGQTTPQVLTVTVSNFPGPGTYQGTITITAPGNNTLSIPVTLNVSGATLALTVTPNSLPFNVPTNSSSQQNVSVLSNGANVTIGTSVQTFTGGNWLTVQSNSATTPATLTVFVNTSALAPATYNGIITVSGTGVSSQTIQVSLTVTRQAFSVDPLSLMFNAQAGGPSPDPQTVNLFFSGGPFSITASDVTLSGGSWLFVTQPSAAPTAVTVSVNINGLARGTYNGTITFTPADTTIPAIRVQVSLTINAGPGAVINGVVNAASGVPGPVAPGEIITIFGVNPGPAAPLSLTLTSSNTVATSLGGIRVLFDGIPGPLTYVSATQINAIVPYEIFGRVHTQLQVEFNGVASQAVDLGVTTSTPGIFTVLAPNQSQIPNQAAALNQDNTVNGQGNGALPNSIVTLFATGEGQTSPSGVTGAITGATLSQPLLPVAVQIAGLPATVTYAGTAPGLVAGVMQVNVQVPATAPRGLQVQVTLNVGGNMSNTASIAIAP